MQPLLPPRAGIALEGNSVDPGTGEKPAKVDLGTVKNSEISVKSVSPAIYPQLSSALDPGEFTL